MVYTWKDCRKLDNDIIQEYGLKSAIELSKGFRMGTSSKSDVIDLLHIIVKRRSLDKYPAAYKLAFYTLVRQGYLDNNGAVLKYPA